MIETPVKEFFVTFIFLSIAIVVCFVSWYLTAIVAGSYVEHIPGFDGEEMAMPRVWIKMFVWTIVFIKISEVLGPIAKKIVI